MAVSTGLLRSMNDDQVEGVLGHEVTHIANGDMVTMTLLQGVVNAFAMFLSRVIAWALVQGRRSDDRDSSVSYGTVWIVQLLIEMVLLFLGQLLVLWFSRWREFRADAGGARLAGRQSMIGALRALQRDADIAAQVPQPAVQTLRISSPGGVARLFMSHPPLDERIARLEQMVA